MAVAVLEIAPSEVRQMTAAEIMAVVDAKQRQADSVRGGLTDADKQELLDMLKEAQGNG